MKKVILCLLISSTALALSSCSGFFLAGSRTTNGSSAAWSPAPSSSSQGTSPTTSASSTASPWAPASSSSSARPTSLSAPGMKLTSSWPNASVRFTNGNSEKAVLHYAIGSGYEKTIALDAKKDYALDLGFLSVDTPIKAYLKDDNGLTSSVASGTASKISAIDDKLFAVSVPEGSALPNPLPVGAKLKFHLTALPTNYSPEGFKKALDRTSVVADFYFGDSATGTTSTVAFTGSQLAAATTTNDYYGYPSLDYPFELAVPAHQSYLRYQIRDAMNGLSTVWATPFSHGAYVPLGNNIGSPVVHQISDTNNIYGRTAEEFRHYTITVSVPNYSDEVIKGAIDASSWGDSETYKSLADGVDGWAKNGERLEKLLSGATTAAAPTDSVQYFHGQAYYKNAKAGVDLSQKIVLPKAIMGPHLKEMNYSSEAWAWNRTLTASWTNYNSFPVEFRIINTDSYGNKFGTSTGVSGVFGWTSVGAYNKDDLASCSATQSNGGINNADLNNRTRARSTCEMRYNLKDGNGTIATGFYYRYRLPNASVAEMASEGPTGYSSDPNF